MKNTDSNFLNATSTKKTQLTSNIDQNIKYITEAIMQAADKSIPNKIVTIKPSDHPWITCHIKT